MPIFTFIPNISWAKSISPENILLISGFSGNGHIESGVIEFASITTSGSSIILDVQSYDSQIVISDFYVNLYGSIEYYSNGQNTSNVDLILNGFTTLYEEHTDNSITDNTGSFSFLDLLPGTYFIIPSKVYDSEFHPEISSTDASQIARSSVGLIELSQQQQLAADVTLNESISG